MAFFDWLGNNHEILWGITLNITKDKDTCGDLYSCVVEQLLKKQHKLNELTDQEKKYYFIKVLKTNYYSKTSPYHYEYRKHQHNHIPLLEEITEDFSDEEYEETIPDIEWVEKRLEEDFDWYSRDLFMLWIELGTLTNVSHQTRIPLNSVGRHINKTKKKLRELWQQELGN